VEIVEVGVAALVVRLGEEVVEHLVDVGRSLRRQEDDDDDDHHQRDVVALKPIVRLCYCTQLYWPSNGTDINVKEQRKTLNYIVQ